MNHLTIQQAFEAAIQLHQSGQLAQAENIYRHILLQQPKHADALHHLGLVAWQQGSKDIAVELIQRSLVISPGLGQAHYNLGILLSGAGQFDQAIAAFESAIKLNPNSPIAFNDLAIAFKGKRQLEKAIAACQQAIKIDPRFFKAFNNLGNILHEMERLDEATGAYRKAIEIDNTYADAHYNLAVVLLQKGQFDEAISTCQHVCKLRPEFAEAFNNLGIALKGSGRFTEAIAAYRQAIHIRPGYAQAHNNLGNALGETGQLDQAFASFQSAIAIKPDFAEAFTNLANILKTSGQIDSAIAAYHQALRIDPTNAKAHSNLLYALHFHPHYDFAKIAQEHLQWNQLHAEPLRKRIQPHSNDRRADRCLRIGYVSPDFRDHVVGHGLLPLIQLHDRRQFHITCYSDVVRADAVTKEVQRSANEWRNIVGLSDDRVANQIRQDQIDILVDLSLHAERNRMLVFAQKPAPVQVTYLGYCSTSGLSAMDYRMSDPFLDPPGTDLSLYSEKTIYLGQCYWCYQPMCETPDPAPPPFLANGFITFGCLNNFAKVSEPALDLWALILRRVPNSRLILHTGHGSHRDRMLNRFTKAGVEPGRIEFVGPQPLRAYMETYDRIDVALDPFPYGGGITSCDSLWMGVPLITLLGKQSPVSRGGCSILSNLGLSELIAKDFDAYVETAADLAADRNRLTNLRQTLRSRMRQSPLMDAPKFVHNMQAAYRQMWRAWCER